MIADDDELVELLNSGEREADILDSHDLTTFRIYKIDALNHTILSKEEGRRLARLAQAGNEEAREELILHNLRLVVSIAKRYIGRGVALMDLIQEGNMGVMSAVEKFDLARNTAFPTYAIWWIRQKIIRSIANTGREIRLPVHLQGRLNKYDYIMTALTLELRRTPTRNEMAIALDITREQLIDLEIARERTHLLSLSTPIGDDGDDELEALIPDRSSTSTEELGLQEGQRQSLRGALDKAMSKLSRRERLILELRLGHDRTLTEVGKEIGLSRERIRQIELEALAKVRIHSQKQILEPFMQELR